jgi:hypothetical protein
MTLFSNMRTVADRHACPFPGMAKQKDSSPEIFLGIYKITTSVDTFPKKKLTKHVNRCYYHYEKETKPLC